MLVHKVNYYRYNHSNVKQLFEGNPEFLNEFTIRNEFWPVAVYHLSTPNKLKGQKDFLLFGYHPKRNPMWIRELSFKQIEAERYQYSVLCRRCNEVIYSIMRYDLHTCSCGSYYVDGGKEVFLHGKNLEDVAEAEVVILDLLTDQVMPSDFKGPVRPQPIQKQTTESKLIIIPSAEEIMKLGLSTENLEREIFYLEDL